MPKRKRFYQDEIHKSITRDRFIQSCSPEAAKRLREVLEFNLNKREEKRHE